MACSTGNTPNIPPLRCRDFTSWPLGDMQHVVVDHGPNGSEVLHIGPDLEDSKRIYFHPGIAEAVGEALAVRLTQKAAA